MSIEGKMTEEETKGRRCLKDVSNLQLECWENSKCKTDGRKSLALSEEEVKLKQ